MRKTVSSLLLLVLLTAQLPARELEGVWLSPDWLFPGTRRYTEAEVRATARETFEALQAQGITDVFLETFLRGYAIAPAIERERYSAEIIDYQPGVAGIPVYPHLFWNYRVEAETVIDPLQIFIEEGQLTNINVHAWIHAFYWRMDNPEIMLSWHNGPSLWNQLMSDYLKEQSWKLEGKEGASPKTLALMRQASELFSSSSDGHRLGQILEAHGLAHEERPMGVLIREALRAGAEPPDFLLIHSVEDPFPAARGRRLRPVYVNPQSPAVRAHLVKVVDSLLEGHPDLAGIHLDHIRYPVDGHGFPERLGIMDGSYRYFEASDPSELARYRDIHEVLSARRRALATLVNEIATRVRPRHQLSAAVLPLYYRDRDDEKFRVSGNDFSSQAWFQWDVDFVVPMMYEFHPYLIRNLVKLYESKQLENGKQKPITIYPGVSRLRVARKGIGESPGWVFFDLNLARDVQLKKENTEDLDFGPD